MWIDIQEFSNDLTLLEQADSLFYLHRFEVEHCIQFDTYVSHKRQELLDKIYGLLKTLPCETDFQIMEYLCKKLIETDELCETYYYLLIEIYEKMNHAAMAQRTYETLCNTLMHELGIEPEKDMAEALDTLQKQQPVQKKPVPPSVFEEMPPARELPSQSPPKDFGKTKEENITELLEWLSIFPDPISEAHLSRFLSMDRSDFVECVEFLVRKSKIKETERDQKIYYSVLKNDMEKNIYEKISLTKRRHIHLLAAEEMEMEFLHLREESLLPKLVYHYMRGENFEKSDQYLKNYLYYFMSMSNDFFPVVKDYPVHYHTDTYANNMQQLSYIMEQLECYVRDYQNTVNPDAFETDRVILYTKMLLQMAVKQSDYTAAWNYLQILDEYPTEYGEANRQKAYIYINKRQAAELLSLSEEMLLVCQKHDMDRWGFWQRMKGIALVYMGKLEESKEPLMKAIDFFMEEGRRTQWDTNAAVAYSWIGEIYRLTKHYEEAEKYLNYSLKYTDKIHNISGRTLIYLRMGQCYMDKGNLKEAEKYIRASVKSFEWLGVVWNRSTAYGCGALLAAKNSQWEAALDYLKKQDTYANLIENPYEQLFYLRNIELLRNLPTCSASIKNNLKKLHQSIAPSFSARYKELMEALPSEYERDYLESLN